MVRYKKGEKLTYKPGNVEVTVIHNTLQPGGVNADEATVWVETKQGSPIGIPVAEQDRYLTYDPPKPKWKVWPLVKQ